MPPALRRPPVSWGSVLLSLLAAGFCLLQTGHWADAICPSSGCLLFRDVSVAGISLWWVGAGVFTLVALLCLARRNMLAFYFVALCLAVDCLLLALMIFIAPCVSCLGAALFLGLLFLLLRPVPQGWFTGQSRPSVLFIIWGLLFVANGAAALNEQMGAWVIHGAEHTERRVYFSPSCPACKDAVTAFATGAAFVPVMKDESDFAAIVRLEDGLNKGLGLREAFNASLTGPEPDISLARNLRLRLRLLRNKADILRLGFDKLPLIMINGLPQSLRGADSKPPQRPVTAPAPSANASGLPPELENLDQCKQDETPCEPPR